MEDKRNKPAPAQGPKENREDPMQDRVVAIARVSKVVKGGRRFGFSALVVVGDGEGKVGYGVGKAAEVPDAIRKASDQAKKNLFSVSKVEGTIPFEVVGKYGPSQVLMFPAVKGKGIIAGGSVRTLVELAGIQDIVCKVHGSKNAHNVVRAVANGLKQLVTIDTYAKRREKAPGEVFQQRQTVK
jgi:small subunit ribosomal protein S5